MLVDLGSRTLVAEFRRDQEPASQFADTADEDVPMHDPSLPRERYDHFHDLLATKAVQSDVLARYPLLRRMLHATVDRRLDLLSEMLASFSAHLRSSRSHPFGDVGRVHAAVTTGGDPHNRGRQVLLLELERSALVYKPRPMLADEIVGEVLGLVDAELPDGVRLRLPRILCLDGHGWQEFVRHAPCEDAGGIERYYRRMGVLLAVFAALGTSDLHFENIIAAGEHPQVIDLETLFSHREAPTGDGVSEAFLRELGTSVFNTMMLPLRFQSSPQDFDMAGLGSLARQESKYWRSYVVAARGSDEIRFVKLASELQHSSNVPTWGGDGHPAADFTDTVREGFDLATRILARRVGDLLTLVGAIHVDGLHKSYGAVDAVSGVTFRVRRGRVTGFLGPNGAGKTTTLRAILDLCSPTAGRATINGRRYRELARPLHVVGAALDGAAFSPSQSAVDHLRIYAPLCGADDSRVDELLEVVGLTDAVQRRVGQFSLGMKQRLALATALLGRPEILILDEPANGLDPQGIVWLRFFLRSFVEDSGGTVLVSSHLLAEMEQMVDDVVLIDAGRVVYDGTLADLVNPGAESCVVHGRAVEEVARVLEHAGVPVRRAPMGVAVADASPTETARITAAAEIDPSGFALSRVNLETAFLELTAPGRR